MCIGGKKLDFTFSDYDFEGRESSLIEIVQ